MNEGNRAPCKVWLLTSSVFVFLSISSPIVFSYDISFLELHPDKFLAALLAAGFFLLCFAVALAISFSVFVFRSVKSKAPDAVSAVVEKNESPQISCEGIREPLSKIKCFVELAISYNSERRSAEVLSALKQSFSFIEDLDDYVVSTQRMNDFQRGSLKACNSWVDTSKFFSDLDKRFSVKCMSKPSLVWNCFSSNQVNGMVMMDRGLASLIISSAIERAIESTSRGFVYLSYTVGPGRLLVTVQDSGVGKPIVGSDHPEHQAAMRVFVRALGGSIETDSQENFGTKVTICIPVEFIPANRVEQRVQNKRVEEDAFDCSVNGLKVLVISSDVRYTERLKDMLSPELIRRQDLRVRFCSDSAKAIMLVEEVAFNLIVIDSDMSCMNTKRFLRFLQSDEHQCREAMKVVITEQELDGLGEDISLLADKVALKNDTLLDIKSVIRAVSLRSVC